MIIDIPYEPRVQQLHIHAGMEAKRWGVVVCHRRMGKTMAAINHLIRSALTNTKTLPRYGYFAPTYRMAKTIAWDYLKYFSSDIPGVSYNEAELRADFKLNNSRISLYGAENPQAHRGIYLDGAVLDEYGLMVPSMFSEVLVPALSDRKGWAMLMGTPAGKNSFFDAYEHAKSNMKMWFSCMFKASETKLIPEEELAIARATMSPDEYEQEFECSFLAAIKGAYYASIVNAMDTDGRIHHFPYNPEYLVNTCWDIGIGDDTTIWFFQRIGGQTVFIDYISGHGKALTHYVSELRTKPYLYGSHYAPHDIRVRDLSSGKSRYEVMQALGIDYEIAPKLMVDDGIQATRLWLATSSFDATNCKKGIECLRHYRADYDEKNSTYTGKPHHDWASHGADAMRTGAIMNSDYYQHKSKVRNGVSRYTPTRRTSWLSI